MDAPPEWDRAVFSVGARQITIREVLRAAHFRHALDAAWAAVCRRAEQEDFEPDDDAAQAGSEAFRSGRDLITAEETEGWLDARGLTVDDFSDYFLRCQSTASPDAPDAAPAVPYDDAPDELRDQLRVDLIMSGAFDELAEALARRFASHTGPDAGPALPWPDELRELEAAYERQRASILTPEAREDTLESLRLPLTRVALEVLELESDDAAREALLCLREDGETMADVARDGGYSLRRRQWWVGEMAEDLQPRLLSARDGEVLGPFPNGEEFQIYRLVNKIEARLDDAEVGVRVDEHLARNGFAELTAARICWIIAPLPTYA